MMPVFSQIQRNLYYQITSKPVFTGMVEDGVRAKMASPLQPVKWGYSEWVCG